MVGKPSKVEEIRQVLLARKIQVLWFMWVGASQWEKKVIKMSVFIPVFS